MKENYYTNGNKYSKNPQEINEILQKISQEIEGFPPFPDAFLRSPDPAYVERDTRIIEALLEALLNEENIEYLLTREENSKTALDNGDLILAQLDTINLDSLKYRAISLIVFAKRKGKDYYYNKDNNTAIIEVSDLIDGKYKVLLDSDGNLWLAKEDYHLSERKKGKEENQN